MLCYIASSFLGINQRYSLVGTIVRWSNKCNNCDEQVFRLNNGSYRNHCPFCLFSLHVDNIPGDRNNTCKGLMEPTLQKRESKATNCQCLMVGFFISTVYLEMFYLCFKQLSLVVQRMA